MFPPEGVGKKMSTRPVGAHSIFLTNQVVVNGELSDKGIISNTEYLKEAFLDLYSSFSISMAVFQFSEYINFSYLLMTILFSMLQIQTTITQKVCKKPRKCSYNTLTATETVISPLGPPRRVVVKTKRQNKVSVDWS